MPQKKDPTEEGQGAGMFSLLGTASTMGLHMVSGPIVGGALGWLIDLWLDSWPIGAGIGLVLGVAAGFRNVWADARFLIREQERPAGGSSSGAPDARGEKTDGANVRGRAAAPGSPEDKNNSPGGGQAG